MKITERLLEHKKILLLIAIIWTILVTYFCLKEGIKLPPILPKGADKLGHVVFHAGIVLFWFLALKSSSNSFKTQNILMKSILLSLFYGILIEICQALFTTTRSADWRDVLANCIGASIACLTIQLARKYLLRKQGI